MTTRPLLDIEPSPPQRWRIGLFENSGAQQLGPDAIDRLGGGISYENLPVLTDPGAATFDPCDTADPDVDDSAILEWQAWGAIHGARCSALSGDDGTLAASVDLRGDLGLNDYAGASSTDLESASGERTRDVTRLFE